MWNRFPEVLGLDNTYKTNRFKMCLFQVTGVTDQKSVANFAFDLVGTERQEGYDWLCDRLGEFREQLQIPEPCVVITDKEKGLKNSLERVFPGPQQQLCLYHIHVNVDAKIVSRWKDPEDDEAESVETASEAASPVPDPHTDELAELDADELAQLDPMTAAAASKPPFENSKVGLQRGWRSVCYAEEEEHFEEAWAALTSFFAGQRPILDYLVSEYLPWADQFLQCRLKRYRNFGQRTNSPTETAHKDIKTYLLTSTSGLLHLHEAVCQMIAKKERDYIQEAARQEVKMRQSYIGQGWLGSLPTQISYTAVEQEAQQHSRLEASIKEKKELPPCRDCCYFTQQYALPCIHAIKEQLQTRSPLTKEMVHPRWWLDKPLVLFPANSYEKPTNRAS